MLEWFFSRQDFVGQTFRSLAWNSEPQCALKQMPGAEQLFRIISQEHPGRVMFDL